MQAELFSATQLLPLDAQTVVLRVVGDMVTSALPSCQMVTPATVVKAILGRRRLTGRVVLLSALYHARPSAHSSSCHAVRSPRSSASEALVWLGRSRVSSHRSSSLASKALVWLLLRRVLMRDLPIHPKRRSPGCAMSATRGRSLPARTASCCHNADMKTAQRINLCRPKMALKAAYEGTIRELDNALKLQCTLLIACICPDYLGAPAGAAGGAPSASCSRAADSPEEQPRHRRAWPAT